MQKFKFNTEAIWPLYDTNEEVEDLEMDIADIMTKTKKEKKLEESVQSVLSQEATRNPKIKMPEKEKPVVYEEDQ